nr:MAG TPA: hypothetical protein [Caudoviricetes sp.]
MNIRNSILESLSEGMLANSFKSNGTSLKAFKDLLNGDIPDSTALFVIGIDFNVNNNYKTFLKSKRHPDKKTILSNVYRIADDLLLIEFKYMKLPVCLLVTFNNGDSFDVACDKLEVAFDSPVDRARDVISSLTSYGVVATTYNTTRGSGTFCVEASEVIESFLYWYYKSESTKGVKRCCIDSELYKYVTITGIIFKNLCLGNTSDLQIDVVCSINSGEDSKVRDLIDTLNTPMNMFAHINGGSLDISLLLKS